MKYYYLNEQKEVQGPFTAEQMRRMLVEGIIDGHTPASAEGGSGWQQLALLDLSDTPAPPVPEPAAELGACPHCGAMLVAAAVPAVCPHCGRTLHPGTEDLWQNAVYAFKQMFNYRGRATRREYWSFTLFSMIVQYGFSFINGILVGATMRVDPHTTSSSGELAAGIVAAPLISMLISLVLTVASLGVTVRRMHDTGHSGWWVAAPFACLLLVLPGIFLFSIAHDPGMMLGIFGLVAALATLGCSLYVLIQMLMPSQCGPNKYGPSLLFPRG